MNSESITEGYDEILPGFYFVKGTWPCPNRFLIKGTKNVLIDSGCDVASAELLAKKQQIDILINTHFHIDHICCNWKFPHSEIWTHALEKEAISTATGYKDQAGIFDESYHAPFKKSYREIPVSRTISDNERLDFGSVKLQVLHTPGHSPGHLSFWENEHKILLASDITLNHFGPWYGYASSDIEQFIASIHRLRDLQPEIVYTSHEASADGCGRYDDKIAERFTAYENIIYEREDRIYQSLTQPRTLSELVDMHLIYGKHFTAALYAFEYTMVYKHLRRLLQQQKIFSAGYTFSQSPLSWEKAPELVC